MNYALPQILPEIPPGGLVAGIDWASAEHVICIIDGGGRVRARFTAAHSARGFGDLIAGLREAGCGEIAIERGEGLLVDALMAAGLTVVVIGPRQIKNLRSRYRSGGGKDDHFDACVLADTLRTGRVRLHPLMPDLPATMTLRAAVRARRDLVRHRVAACNQLRAHLDASFPGPAGLFASLDSPVSLAFLTRFRCQDDAGQLDEQQLAAWLASLPGRGRPAPAAVLLTRLRSAARGAAGAEGAARAVITSSLTAALITLSAQIRALEAVIAAQLDTHPDGHVFTSLPRVRALRAARLVAEIGDCRARFPGPETLAALAGVSPVTRQSGQHISHTFRRAVSHELRDAVCDFADGSRHDSPWAAGIYAAARDRGKDHPHAVRILARAWIYVIWRCWHDGAAYDPARHAALQRVLDAGGPGSSDGPGSGPATSAEAR
jgi:transposase